MKPKEELANQILETKSGDLTKTLKPFAIGKWVPVSERLPERDARGNWTGIVKCRDGVIAPVIFKLKNTPVAIFTHWLELDIPEVEL